MESSEGLLSKESWSRNGATAGRGFHFQDAVGAWWAAQMLADSGWGGRVVPEGFEDLHIEGDELTYVQVKSRKDSASYFTPTHVASILTEMWAKHSLRLQDGHPDGSLILVLERPVRGCNFKDESEKLSTLPGDHPVRKALESVVDPSELGALLLRAGIVVLSWDRLSESATEAISKVSGASPAVCRLVDRELRVLIAEAADANASAKILAEAHGIDRLAAHGVVDDLVRMVDRESLEAALVDGTCDVLDFRVPESQSAFLEGMPARPGHIAAGIVAPRTDLTDKVLHLLEIRKAVLISGPSGVGKSTLMWSAIHRKQDALWYRINRLDDAAVSKLVELAKASRANHRSQIGFVVDGIGIGEAQAWDQLQRSLSMQAGVLLLGSVRQEDMFPLATAADCGVVKVSLDEELAKEIYAKLRQLGATTASYWREAYEQANGLTMEYTYLLSQGQRLPDVLREQVRRRVHEGRETELQIISCVTTAHQWDLAVPVVLIEKLAIDPSAIRVALARLRDEHLVVESGTELSGTHALRSRFLSVAVHSFPPPHLEATIGHLVLHLPEEALPALVTGALRDYPELKASVLANLATRICVKPNPSVLATSLRALRLADLEQRSHEWATDLKRHEIPPSLRTAAIQFSLLDEDEANELWPVSVQKAIAELRSARLKPSLLLGEFIAGLGHSHLVDAIRLCSTSTAAAELLSAISSSPPEALEAVAEAILERRDDLCALTRVLREGTLEEAGHVLLAGQDCGSAVAEALLVMAGGSGSMVARLRMENIWTTEVTCEERDGLRVIKARILFVSDKLQGTPDGSVREFAKSALSCLPTCNQADVQAFLPGDVAIDSGTSKLQRRYLHSPNKVDMNRRTAAIASAAFQTGTRTERVATTLEFLPVLREYLDLVGRLWILGEHAERDRPRAVDLRESLRSISALMVPVSRPQEFLLSEAASIRHDAVHTLFTGIVDNMTGRLGNTEDYGLLGAYVRSTLRPAVTDVENQEDWDYLDAAAPPELQLIDNHLEDIAAILAECRFGNTPTRDLLREARSGHRSGALSRVASLCERNARLRHEHFWRQLAEELKKRGLRTLIHQRHLDTKDDGWPAIATCIEVQVASIFEWSQRLDEAVQLMQGARESYVPPVILFPSVGGERVDELAVSLFQQPAVHRGLNQDTEWDKLLPPSVRTPLTDLVTEAHQAIQLLSGVAVIGTYRGLDEFEEILGETGDAFIEARDGILRGPDDDLTRNIVEVLHDHAQRAIDDLQRADDGEPMNGSFIESINSMASPDPSVQVLELNMIRTFALQADLNRTVALENLT
ncbi:hypothetical protein LRQ04_16390 [Paenarthrobacter sp. AR 02]|uniref:hypothetical protein n=1 Tax=Paenarthrobacter sp. AR 02 TaxID=2899821 RepID=UPI001F40FD19|nr:hypothetical protein [Paenarthrobacter sp. AR 02]MCF3140836.1 hypothetical protein [Paenarthrobacter sp. AR 02]